MKLDNSSVFISVDYLRRPSPEKHFGEVWLGLVYELVLKHFLFVNLTLSPETFLPIPPRKLSGNLVRSVSNDAAPRVKKDSETPQRPPQDRNPLKASV